MAGGPKLSNEFRDSIDKQKEAERDPVEVEAEKVGKAVMMQRDMHATMRSLQMTKMVSAMDRAHTEAAIRVYDEFIEELAVLPISGAVRDIGLGIQKQLEGLQKAADGSQLTRASEVMLEALEMATFETAVGHGTISDVKIYNRALSATEIAELEINPDPNRNIPEESLGETAESLDKPEDESLDDEPKDVDEAI